MLLNTHTKRPWARLEAPSHSVISFTIPGRLWGTDTVWARIHTGNVLWVSAVVQVVLNWNYYILGYQRPESRRGCWIRHEEVTMCQTHDVVLHGLERLNTLRTAISVVWDIAIKSVGEPPHAEVQIEIAGKSTHVWDALWLVSVTRELSIAQYIRRAPTTIAFANQYNLLTSITSELNSKHIKTLTMVYIIHCTTSNWLCW